MQVLRGGPVDTQRGFVLHSSDFFLENSTLPIDEGISLTATLDILKAIAAARDRAARSSRSAMPDGRRGSSRTRSSITVGCTARPMPS